MHEFTEKEQALVAKAIAWLAEKWGTDHPCPYCGNETWDVGTPLTVLVAAPQDLYPDVRGRMSPMFPVMCTNCGHTTFINAVVAGIVPEPSP